MAKFAKLKPKLHTRNRLIPLKDERIGASELGFVQSAFQNQDQARVVATYDTPGLIIQVHPNGKLAQDWKVIDGGGSGKLKILAGVDKPALAIDKNGDIIQLNNDETTAVDFIPDAGKKYISVKKAVQNYELGKITVPGNGGTTIVGIGTKFMEFSSKDSLGRGDFIELLADDLVDDSNAGRFEIQTIINDTTLTLVTGPTGAAEATPVKFRIAGSFYKNIIPSNPAIHEFDHFAFMASDNPPNFDSAEELLAYVERNGESISIRDLRRFSLAKLRNVPTQAATRLVPEPIKQGPVQLVSELGRFDVSVVEVEDVQLVAFFANSQSDKRIRISVTNDGITWVNQNDVPVGVSEPVKPDVIRLLDKSLLLCFYNEGIPSALYVIKSEDTTGVVWGTAVLIVSETDLAEDESINTQSLFQDERGNIYLFYQIKKDNDSAATWKMKRSTDGGTTWPTSVDIATVGASRRDDRGGCVQTNNGDLYFIFSRSSGNTAIIEIYKSTDQGLSWENRILNISITKPAGDAYAISKPLHIESTNEIYIFFPTIFGAENHCLAYLKIDNIETNNTSILSRKELLYLPIDNDFSIYHHISAIQRSNKDIALILSGTSTGIDARVIFRKTFPLLMG